MQEKLENSAEQASGEEIQIEIIYEWKTCQIFFTTVDILWLAEFHN